MTALKCSCGAIIDEKKSTRSFKHKGFWVWDCPDGMVLSGKIDGVRTSVIACNNHLTDEMKEARGGFVEKKPVFRKPTVKRKT